MDLMYLFGARVANGLRILQGMEVEVLDPLTNLDVGIVTSSPLPPPAGRSRLYAELSIALSDVFEPFPLDLVFLEKSLQEALEGQRMNVRMSELARSDEDGFCQDTTVSAAAESYPSGRLRLFSILEGISWPRRAAPSRPWSTSP
mgnify:CR=1 FL=1